jgi:DNA-binding response OmpR family regulator
MVEQPYILVIEDDAKLNRLFSKLLTAIGCRVESAYTVGTALNLLTYGAVPQIAIVDLELEGALSRPVLDLLEKPAFDHTRTVIISDQDLDHASDYLARADHTLIKPVSPQSLTTLVKMLV